jgi:hypothetical protein
LALPDRASSDTISEKLVLRHGREGYRRILLDADHVEHVDGMALRTRPRLSLAAGRRSVVVMNVRIVKGNPVFWENWRGT